MMKLKACASVTSLFKGFGVIEAVKIAKSRGFGALEFQLFDGVDVKAFAAQLKTAGLEVALINFGIGDLLSGGYGLSGVPAKQKDFFEALNITYNNANMLDAKIVNIGPSLVPEGVPRDECVAQLMENLKYCLDKFAHTDVKIAIEAMNTVDWPAVLVNSPEMCLDIIDRIGSEQLTLQYDFYHSAMDGRDIPADLQKMIQNISHIQFADYPGRGEPGSGRTDFRSLFDQLRKLNYRHYVGAEYTPMRPVEQTLFWMELL